MLSCAPVSARPSGRTEARAHLPAYPHTPPRRTPPTPSRSVLLLFFVLPPLRALRGLTFPLLFLRSSPRRARPIKRKCGFSVLPARLLSFCFLVRSARVLLLVCRSAYSLPLVLPLRLPALSCAVLLLFLARPLSSVRFCFALPLPFLCFNFKSCILRNVIYIPFRTEFRRI